MATCQIHIHKKYLLKECSREALTDDPKGLCLLHSQQADKNEDGAFTEAVKAKLTNEDYDFRGVFFTGPAIFLGKFKYEKEVDFSGATFTGPAYFFEAAFKEEAKFRWATFEGEASFFLATFTKRADFGRATFKKEVDLGKATFTELARFYRATFQGEANFSFVTFAEEARFSLTTFESDADFSGVTFTVLADFSETTFQGEARFVRIKPQKWGEPPPSIFSGDFHNVTVEKEASLVFQDCSLAKVNFAGTDLRRVEFHNVTWARRHGRNVVYDEMMLYQPEEMPIRGGYARVEELYRQLKLNYEKEGDLKNAGDFHYGEMEMHRRANPGQVWYQFYWALSGYGERPLRALIALLVILLGFSGLYLLLEPNLFGTSLLASLGNAILYVFQKGTLQRPDLPKQAGDASQVLGAIIPVLIPGQVALFFLALRNRLGRRR
jgi:uncharacterized protein YjbI with pentapeptide repeats